MSKLHNWTEMDDTNLKNAIDDCEPIFEHFRGQNKSYTEANAWDAVAGRLLPDVCVTGAACRRRWEILKKKNNDTWQETIDKVNQYERDLAETTFDGVSEILGNMDALHERMTTLEQSVSKLLKQWENNETTT